MADVCPLNDASHGVTLGLSWVSDEAMTHLILWPRIPRMYFWHTPLDNICLLSL